jgi:hypothetical protein
LLIARHRAEPIATAVAPQGAEGIQAIETVDGIRATASKTYYLLANPRMGVWKARFSLLPIHDLAGAKYSTQSADFNKWMNETSWVNITPQAQQWYSAHAADIHARKIDYMRKWDKASARQKQELTLRADDGK